MEDRCVKCLGNHSYKECNKPVETPPTCVNCGEHHPANYRGCKYYLNNKSIRNATNRSNQIRTSQTNDIRANTPPSNTQPPQRTYADTVKTQPITANYINTQPTSSSTQNNITEQIISFLLNLITPHTETIKQFFMNLIFSNAHNGPK